MPSAAFVKFWRTDLTRDCFLSYTTNDDLQSLRLVSRDFAEQVAPHLFADTQISFHVNTFSRQARMVALERIGSHIKTLTFHLPHNTDTFLPPLLDPITGEEQIFNYQPHCHPSRPSSSHSHSSSPKYGSLEMTDILIKQYPPLFHAATNISSFVRAITAMKSLRHLRISCPDQVSTHRYRRSIVDYAIISLRVALEQVCPPHLTQLTVSPIHPSALLHLRPQFSLGASPRSTRLWRRLSALDIAMTSVPFSATDPTDHLKILHSYLSNFRALESLQFRWIGAKGPSPLSLDLEPCTSRPTSLDCATACPVTSVKPSCRPLKFRKLKTMRLENAVLDASQAAAFVMTHRKVLHEFEFEQCQLRSGTWDDALAPLTRIAGNEDWKRKQEEVMDVPIVLEKPGLMREEMVNHMLWEDERKRSRGLQALRKVSMKTKEMLNTGGGVEHMKKLLRGSMMKWY